MEDFWKVLIGIKTASLQSGVSIVTGDTKVVERGKGDQIFINTSGIGLVHPKAKINHNRIYPGDQIIISGNLAQHGIAIMSQRQGLSFETDIKSDTVNLNHTVLSLIEIFGDNIKFLRDPTRGGLASVLNELAEIGGLGYVMEQSKIPILEQVEGACEMLGLDPLYVANEGIFVAIVSAEIADELVNCLHNDINGKDACIIGEVTKEHAGKVLLKSKIGGHRVVGYLTGEQLPRIC